VKLENKGEQKMSTVLVPLSTWLHSLATIVMVGYFFFARLVYLPELERQLSPKALRELLERVSVRLKPFFGGALLVFMIGGFHLMLVNQSYLGFGHFTGNLWSVLITVKHVLVVGFLAVAMVSERRYLGESTRQPVEALRAFKSALSLDILLGVLILLLTAIAQAG
jgi:uncharacterized membrane protein